MIDSGKTVDHIMRLISIEFAGRALCKGIFLHEDGMSKRKTWNTIPVYYVDKSAVGAFC